MNIETAEMHTMKALVVTELSLVTNPVATATLINATADSFTSAELEILNNPFNIEGHIQKANAHQ